VTGLSRNAAGIDGVLVDGKRIDADAVVLAMGPWSLLAAEWLPLPAVFGLKGHSVVYETGSSIPPAALFLEYEEASGTVLSPEVFPRPDGTTYVCAISSRARPPADPREVAPDADASERLHAMCCRLSPVLANAKVLARQACFRPVTEDGLPLIGAIAGVAGAYVATGHSVWGILNAPATGEAIAELIVEGVSTLDLSAFDPNRMPAYRPQTR
jgi:glycine/D-amino acid oxidase-like deaminating enzyme